MAAKKYKIDAKRWPGVYGYDSDIRKINGRADTCYYITFRADGRFVWEKIGWKSEGYSPEMAAELRAERIKTGRHGKTVKTAREINREKVKHNRTVNEIKEAYFNSERGLHIKGRITDLNRYDKHLKKHFGDRQVSVIGQLDIERFKREMRGHATATVANALELLRRLINYGVKHKFCPPLSFTIELPHKDNEVTEYLTPEEARRLMDTLDTWPNQDVARMVRIVWLTGMRRGEIFKLEDRDCDFQQGLIRLRGPKGGKDQTIPMPAPIKEILLAQLADRDEKYPGSQYIFPGKNGGQRVDSSAVNRIKQAAGLPDNFRPFHGLRHHLATTLASSGEFTLDMIGQLLTHKSHAMTRRYAKFLPDAQKAAADKAACLLQAHVAKGKQVVGMADRSQTGKAESKGKNRRRG